MQLITHGFFHDGVCDIARAMAGVEHGLWIVVCQPTGKSDQFIFRLMMVQQVESSHNGRDRPGACSQDILQSTMGAAGEKQSVDIESQLMTEIIRKVVALIIPNEQMPVALGHGMGLWNMSHDTDAVGDLTGMVHHDGPLPYPLRPYRGDAVQVISHGIELSIDGLWRYDDFRPFVNFYKMTQTSRMVAVAMGDEDIIHRPEIDIHLLRIADEHVTGSCVEQDAMMPRLQQDGQPVLRL